jgi:hypothetical protein
MTQYSDMILVTDKIRDIDKLVKQIKFPNRILLECFVISECDEAIKSGISNVAMNIDLSTDKIDNYISVLRASGIFAITSGAQFMKPGSIALKNAKRLVDLGFVNLVYTSNEASFMENSFGHLASAFYSDFGSVTSQKCILDIDDCRTY